jgi:hypothetical protein
LLAAVVVVLLILPVGQTAVLVVVLEVLSMSLVMNLPQEIIPLQLVVVELAFLLPLLLKELI